MSVRFESFAALPQRAVVGTSSLRRQAQLRGLRPDLEVREMRGNVDTRLRKLQDGQYDAIVLAAAGLDRLQQTQWVRARFAPREMCPAAGQGALAIECRAGDPETRSVIAALDHAPTRFAVAAERAALAALEGGCHVPVGVHCEPEGIGWLLTAIVAHPDGSQILRERMQLDALDNDPTRAETAGRTLAARLLEKGAGKILASGEIPSSPSNTGPA